MNSTLASLESHASHPALPLGKSVRGKLLRSHALVAMCGIGALGFMLIMALFLQHYTERLTHVQNPSFHAAAEVSTGVQESLAALKGYVAIGGNAFRDARSMIWSERIAPSISELALLSEQWDSQNDRELLKQLEGVLKKLQNSQWWTEDIAQSPGNEPGRAIYAYELVPIADQIFESITAVIEMEASRSVASDSEWLSVMADVRGFFSLSRTLLVAEVDRIEEVDNFQLEVCLNKTSLQLDYLESHKSEFTDQQQQLISMISDEFSNYRQLVAEVLNAVRSDKWNLARHRLTVETAPLAEEATALLNEITKSRTHCIEADTSTAAWLTNLSIAAAVTLLFTMAVAAVTTSVQQANQLAAPICRLSDATRALALGTLQQDVPVVTDDEIGQLTRYFNLMRHVLEEKNGELSVKHGRLEQLEKRLRATVESAPVAMVMIDKNGTIVLMNRESESLFDYTRDELLGQQIEVLIPQRFRHKHPPLVKDYIDQPSPRIMGEGREVYGLRRDGSEFPVELGLNPVITDEGVFVLSVIVDMTEAKAANAALKESETRFRSIADSAPIGMWITDVDGNCTWLNKFWLDYVGESLEECTSAGWMNCIHPADLQGASVGLRAAFEDRCEYSHEHRMRRNDGEYRWHMALGTPRYDESGAFHGFTGLSVDIHDEKMASRALVLVNESLRESERRAQEASQAKSDFLANVSHEIRTPMNAIIGLTELVLESSLSSIQRDYLQTVAHSSEALLDVINDILDFSKIEAGKLVLDNTTFQIHDLVANLLKTLAVKADQKNIELACHISRAVPDELVGDPGRLRQILINLLGNAIKFTEMGGVSIEIDRLCSAAKKQDGVVLRFSVRDSGIGIPEDKLGNIFEAFEQADVSSSRKFGGTGLGLSISSKLVEAMNGNLAVSSTLNVGSEFTFTAECGTLEGYSPASWRNLAELLRGIRVLIVDDQEITRDSLSRTLDGYQISSATASSADEALAILADSAGTASKFHLVIADANMPNADGYEFLQEMRKSELVSNLPTVLLTSTDTASWRRAGVLDAAVRLAKPVKEEDLIEGMVRAIGQFTQAESQQYPAGSYSDAAAAGSTMIPPLRVLLAEDSVPNQLLATSVLTLGGHVTVVASDGQEAVDLTNKERFDIVLMDIQMPVMDGIAATRAIRAREVETGEHLPIIAMTANALKGDKERYLRAGMDGYVAKPIRRPELWRSIADVIARYGKTVQETSENALQPPLQSRTLSDLKSTSSLSRRDGPLSKANSLNIDWGNLLDLVGGDLDTLIDIASSYGLELGELQATLPTAVEQGELSTLMRSFHKLKSSFRFLCAAKEAELAEELERMASEGDLDGISRQYCYLLERIDPYRVAIAEFCDKVPIAGPATEA